MAFKKISIIGVGLLGGSIGLAVRQHRLASEVAGYVRRPASLKDCERAAAVDYATTDLLAAVSNADLIILGTPLAQMSALAKQFLPALKRGAIVTDVGSVKTEIVSELETILKKSGAHFVGGHPMAGGEKNGVLAARKDLFANAVCVLTPTKKSNANAVKKLEHFWKTLGARILKMTPVQHDLLVSRSSHLPHTIAATLASLVLNPAATEMQSALCATGFRDTTRVASGSPEMWRDIALANRPQLRAALDEFVRELQRVQAILRGGKPEEIETFFTTAKKRRDAWCAQNL